MMDKENLKKVKPKNNHKKKENSGMGMHGKKDHMKSMKAGGMDKKGRCPTCGKKMERKIGPHRGKGPAKLTDAQIKSDVEMRLTQDSWLDASGVKVSFVDGVITLAGEVEDWEAKRRAEDISLQATGVKDVQNNLTLKS